MHRLPPDRTQNQWSRLDYGRMHQDGIFTDIVRMFILSLVSPARRRVLQRQHEALRQPRGTKPILSYIKNDKQGYATFHKSSEKLHHKKHWRTHRLKSDLKPLFEPGSQKTAEVHQFIDTYWLYLCLTSPSPDGFGVRTLQQVKTYTTYSWMGVCMYVCMSCM